MTPSDRCSPPTLCGSRQSTPPAIAGEYKGADDILGYLGKFVELSDGTFTAELQSVTAESDDTVVATHRDKAQRDGKILDHDETLAAAGPSPWATGR